MNLDCLSTCNLFLSEDEVSQTNTTLPLPEVVKKSKSHKKRVIKKISLEQVNVLENIFLQDPSWSTKTISKQSIPLLSPFDWISKWIFNSDQ